VKEDLLDLKVGVEAAAEGLTIVTVEGEIDLSTAPRLRGNLIGLVSNGNHHLVVDLDKVEFLDSAGLGVLIGTLKRVSAYNGSIWLVCSQKRILEVFGITGLSQVFRVFDSLADVRQQFSGSSQSADLPDADLRGANAPSAPPS
jgi:anti-sigma B factor antagonist